MSLIQVDRQHKRIAVYLTRKGTPADPNLAFFLPKMDKVQLDEMIRKQLEAQGITQDFEIQAIVEQAEKDYERRVKAEEVHQEVKRLMAEKEKGNTLMQRGHRKWKVAFYAARGGK